MEEDWYTMDQFVVKNVQQLAFANDALTTTRPMNKAPESNSVVMDYFDRVAYEKC